MGEGNVTKDECEIQIVCYTFSPEGGEKSDGASMGRFGMVVEGEGRMVQKAECPTNQKCMVVANFCQYDIILSQREQPCARVMRSTRSEKRWNNLIFQINYVFAGDRVRRYQNKHSLCTIA
jgi:hypothetical protein